MKRVLLLIIASIGSVACGRAPVLDVGEFAPYVEKFEAIAADHGASIEVVDLRVTFGRMQSEFENGACEIYGDHTPTVYINEKAWNRMNEVDREALIFHELGHCILRRNHVTELESNGVPKSLMHPYRIHSKVYQQYERHYLTELFQRARDF